MVAERLVPSSKERGGVDEKRLAQQAHKRTASHNAKYQGLNAHQIGSRKGYFLYESLKDPAKDSVTRVQGEVLTGRFNEMINELTDKVPDSQPPKPMFGYFPKPGKQETDRSLALHKLDHLTGLRGSHHLKNDEDYLKQEADRIFSKKKALQKYLAGITKPKLAAEQEESAQDDANSKAEGQEDGDTERRSQAGGLDSQKKHLRGVSHRFPQKGDWDSADSYLYVSPTSTAKEKMLRMRSHILANKHGGIKKNGVYMKLPNEKIIEKMIRASKERPTSRASSGEGALRPDSAGSRGSRHGSIEDTLKYQMRRQLQLNLQDTSEYLHNELRAIDPLLTTAREDSSQNAFRSSSRLSGSVGAKGSPPPAFSKTAKPGDGKWADTMGSSFNPKEP